MKYFKDNNTNYSLLINKQYKEGNNRNNLLFWSVLFIVKQYLPFKHQLEITYRQDFWRWG